MSLRVFHSRDGDLFIKVKNFDEACEAIEEYCRNRNYSFQSGADEPPLLIRKRNTNQGTRYEIWWGNDKGFFIRNKTSDEKRDDVSGNCRCGNPKTHGQVVCDNCWNIHLQNHRELV